VVNPVFGVVFVVIFTFYWFTPRKAIWSVVLFCQNMDKFEVKKQNCSDPAIDRRIGLYVRMVKHTTDVEHVHLHYEVVDPDEMKAHGMERAEKAIEFDLGL